MKTIEQYEAEITELRNMNLKLQIELTKALEAIAAAECHAINPKIYTFKR